MRSACICLQDVDTTAQRIELRAERPSVSDLLPYNVTRTEPEWLAAEFLGRLSADRLAADLHPVAVTRPVLGVNVDGLRDRGAHDIEAPLIQPRAPPWQLGRADAVWKSGPHVVAEILCVLLEA